MQEAIAQEKDPSVSEPYHLAEAAPAASGKRSHPRRAVQKKSHAMMIAIIILVVLLLGVGGFAAWLMPKYLDHSGDPGLAKTPTEAVQEFLQALAAGDGTTALLYSTAQPGDTTFLSDSFLATALKAHPITDITVDADQPSASPATIEASYTLDGQAVVAHYTVQKYGKYWRLDWGFLPLTLTSLTNSGVPLSLDNVPLTTDKIYLFPGVYDLTSRNPMLNLSEPSLTVEYPEKNPSFSESFALSDDAVSRIRTAAKAQLDACLASQELNPAGCGFGFAGTKVGTVDPATITWSLPDGAPDITTITPQLDSGSFTMATASFQLTANFHGVSTDKLHLYNDTSSFSQVQADFTDPDQIVVTFG